MHTIRMCQDGILGYWTPKLKGIKMVAPDQGDYVRLEKGIVEPRCCDHPEFFYNLSVKWQMSRGALISVTENTSGALGGDLIYGSGSSAEQAIKEVERKILAEAKLLRAFGSDEVIAVWYPSAACIMHYVAWLATCEYRLLGCVSLADITKGD